MKQSCEKPVLALDDRKKAPTPFKWYFTLVLLLLLLWTLVVVDSCASSLVSCRCHIKGFGGEEYFFSQTAHASLKGLPLLSLFVVESANAQIVCPIVGFKAYDHNNKLATFWLS